MSETAAIVGSGLVGRAWAIAFARAGWRVRIFDADAAAAKRALGTIGDMAADLEAQGLLDKGGAKEAVGRMSIAGSLREALDGAAWMQESTPEDVEVKRRVYAELDAAAPAETILASSTSAIVPSRFTEGLKARGRCVVAHPLNPPYVIPAVELVPAPWTTAETMARAQEVMRAIGQAPIVLTREVDGFVMNRLQGALLEEAFRLVESGVCTAEDVDIGLREGLALRWSFMGPFETIDLNAPAGVADYVHRYQGIYERLFKEMQHRVDWAGPVLDEVVRSRRMRLLEGDLANRQRWRDRRLMALMRQKREASKTIGD
jgi:3-hydroxyacyl-CoA dehydrogenase